MIPGQWPWPWWQRWQWRQWRQWQWRRWQWCGAQESFGRGGLLSDETGTAVGWWWWPHEEATWLP